MIVVHINTTTDGNTLTHCYKDMFSKEIIDNVKMYTHLIETYNGNTLMVNPTRAEVVDVLFDHPEETLMALGHGSGFGLFGATSGYVIDGFMTHLLRNRDMIGIWCHAKDFGKMNNLKGFFTAMFISNPNEASLYRMKKVDEETTQSENIFFADKVNGLIKDKVALNEWTDKLTSNCHSDIDFVKYNYDGLEYLDGKQQVEIIEENFDFGDESESYDDFEEALNENSSIEDLENAMIDGSDSYAASTAFQKALEFVKENDYNLYRELVIQECADCGVIEKYS